MATATCRELLPWEGPLWTFAHVPGVEPTSDQAERVLRHAVLWRKASFGGGSEGGCRFVERTLTVVQTLRLHAAAGLGVPGSSSGGPSCRTPCPEDTRGRPDGYIKSVVQRRGVAMSRLQGDNKVREAPTGSRTGARSPPRASRSPRA